MLRNVFVSLLLLGFVACSHTTHTGGPAEAPKARGYQEHNIMATLWALHSAEYQALGYQAYHAAQVSIDNALAKKVKHPAVVADLDETVLDNIQYQVRNISQDHSYTSESWAKWVSEANAGAIAGAVEFFNYAAKKGVEIYYLSNRKVSEIDATLKNLQNLGFPVKKENLLFRDKDKSKEGRRQVVLKKHGYVVLIGDNLMDFAAAFDDLKTADRKDVVKKEHARFGVDYIVLPNPMYGAWEDALYDNNMKLSDSEKATKRIEWLNKN